MEAFRLAWDLHQEATTTLFGSIRTPYKRRPRQCCTHSILKGPLDSLKWWIRKENPHKATRIMYFDVTSMRRTRGWEFEKTCNIPFTSSARYELNMHQHWGLDPMESASPRYQACRAAAAGPYHLQLPRLTKGLTGRPSQPDMPGGWLTQLEGARQKGFRVTS